MCWGSGTKRDRLVGPCWSVFPTDNLQPARLRPTDLNEDEQLQRRCRRCGRALRWSSPSLHAAIGAIEIHVNQEAELINQEDVGFFSAQPATFEPPEVLEHILGLPWCGVCSGPSTTGVFHCNEDVACSFNRAARYLATAFGFGQGCCARSSISWKPCLGGHGKPLVPAAWVLKASAITNCVSTWFSTLHFDLVCSCLHFKIFKGNRNWDSQLWVAWLRWMYICQLEVIWGTNSRTSTSLFGSKPSGAVAVASELLVAPKWVRSDG